MIRIKKILLSIVLTALVLPMLQNSLHIFRIRPLEGDFVMEDKPAYSKTGWYDGEFQARYNNWLEQNIGFRDLLVRINNQIDFSLFKKPHAEGVEVGRNKILYEYDYIRAYMGDDFIGEPTLDRKMRRLKYMQEYLLKNKNIRLILVLEPSKARYEPEYLPGKYDTSARQISNYELIVQKAGEYNITFLDLNQYFLKMKDSSRYLLYPQYGVHWSEYGMSLAVDTLIGFIEDTCKLDLPDIYVDEIIVSDSLRSTDYDAGKPLNLLWNLRNVPMAYPQMRYENNPDKDRPNVLAVADSYYWNIFNVYLPHNLFNNEAFWYFNSLVYPEFYYGPLYTEDLDLQAEVEKQDIILIMVTERFQFKYDWRFVDNIYELYTPEFEPDHQYNYENDIRMNLTLFDELARDAMESEMTLEEVIRREADFLFITENLQKYLETYGPRYYYDVIRKDTAWFRTIKEKANKQEISVDAQLIKDANYMFKKEYPEIFEKYYAIQSIKDAIKNDPEWMHTIQQKAAEKYLTPEEMIHQDAVWLYNNQ